MDHLCPSVSLVYILLKEPVSLLLTSEREVSGEADKASERRWARGERVASDQRRAIERGVSVGRATYRGPVPYQAAPSRFCIARGPP